MKRIGLLAVIGLLFTGIVWAAAPAQNEWANSLGDTLTVDSQFTSVWELLDSIIVIKTDTCYTLYTISGMAQMTPGDKLYIGFTDGGGAPAASGATDTFLVYCDPGLQTSPAYVPFSVTYLDSLIHQTDANDTIYFQAAVGGSGKPDKVVLMNTVLSAQVLDFNAAGVVGE